MVGSSHERGNLRWNRYGSEVRAAGNRWLSRVVGLQFFSGPGDGAGWWGTRLCPVRGAERMMQGFMGPSASAFVGLFVALILIGVVLGAAVLTGVLWLAGLIG